MPRNLWKASSFRQIQESERSRTDENVMPVIVSAAWQGKARPHGDTAKNRLPQPSMQTLRTPCVVVRNDVVDHQSAFVSFPRLGRYLVRLFDLLPSGHEGGPVLQGPAIILNVSDLEAVSVDAIGECDDILQMVEVLAMDHGVDGQRQTDFADPGSQFTSVAFTQVRKDAGVKISMDGRGRWMDNVMIERLRRSLKYECVYLQAFKMGSQARTGIGGWIDYYNTSRPRSVFDGRTPEEVYIGRDTPSPGHAPEMASEMLAA